MQLYRKLLFILNPSNVVNEEAFGTERFERFGIHAIKISYLVLFENQRVQQSVQLLFAVFINFHLCIQTTDYVFSSFTIRSSTHLSIY